MPSSPNLLLANDMSSADFTIESCIAEVNNDPKCSDLSLLEKMKLAKEIFDLKMTMVMQMKQLNAPSQPSPPPAPSAPSPAPSQQINVNSAQSTLNITQTVNVNPTDEIT
jgi:hypothetical protein